MDDIDRAVDHAWNKNYKRTGTIVARVLAGLDSAVYDLMAKDKKTTAHAR